MGIQAHDHAGRGPRHQNRIFFAENRDTRVLGIRPGSNPTKTQITIEAVEIRHARQETKGMFPHVDAQ